MDRINLDIAARRALELLMLNGMGKKGLRTYTHTGFGCIIRHFRTQRRTNVTDEMIDTFILEQRTLYEQGKISSWKWQVVHRGCELLKWCAKNDTISMPKLQPWIPALQKRRQSIQNDTPTSAQLADPQNIFALVWKTNKDMKKLGYAESTIIHYTKEGLAIILNRHYAAGTERFSKDIIDQLVLEKRRQYEKGLIPRTGYQNVHKAAYYLLEYYNTGHLNFSMIPRWGFRNLKEPFYSLWKEFLLYIEQEKRIARSTRLCARSAIYRFLILMEDQGLNSMADFTREKINILVSVFAKRYKGGLRSIMHLLKLFFHFLFDTGRTPLDLCECLPELVATRKSFHEGFSDNEIKLLLKQPDRSTSFGKRDYAIMVLGFQTGLRACDVVNLKLKDIDWRNREIRLVQQKTGKPLAIPLQAETGNALADYILHARRNTHLPYLFLCNNGPVRAIGARSASSIVSRYLKRLGIDSKWRAFHALRRTFGTRLLQNKTPFELIQQLLGHSDMNSVKPYLSIDELGLKECALSFPVHGKEGR